MAIRTNASITGNFHQHADDGRECSTGVQTEQYDGCGDGQFEEVAGADQRRRRGHVMWYAPGFRPAVGDEENQEGLYCQRHCDQQDVQWVADPRG